MPPVVRLGDSSTGHGCFPPKSNVAASGNVLVNGIGAHRVGDAWAVHCGGICGCHDSVAAAGSGSVMVNGMPVARVGDSISCGCSCAAGSGNVIAG